MKRKMSFLVAGLLCLSLCLGAEAAGTVTDTLTVRVGYYGMEQDRYVEVATYHWSELYDALPLHYEAYSFFRSTDDGTYNTVIDSAYGFYLADLLDYAGIYSGDIAVVAFYTRDQSVGFFTSFTYADLFGTQRYYYNDLSAHISPVYDENGTLTGYDGDEAWNDCWTVQPMLALEDSWVSYEIGTEHTAPNYSSLGTGNRFRLLFGQSYPLECRTNQSAKYTHTLFITLQGAPEITEEPPELDGTLGSHSATFQISVGHRLVRQLRSGDHRHHRHAGRAVFRPCDRDGALHRARRGRGRAVVRLRRDVHRRKPAGHDKAARGKADGTDEAGGDNAVHGAVRGTGRRALRPDRRSRTAGDDAVRVHAIRGSTVRTGRADGGRGPGEHPHVRPAGCTGRAAAGRRAGGSAGRSRSGACHRCYGAAGG